MPSSFSELNTYSDTELTFTDLRTAKVVFDRSTPTQQTASYVTGGTFDLPLGINIIEIVLPDVELVYFQVNVSNVSGATVAWPNLPAGYSVTTVGAGVYRVSNIQSRADWDLIKLARVTMPAGFKTTFNATAVIGYETTREKTWTTVVLNTDRAVLTASSSISATGRYSNARFASAVSSSFTVVARGGFRKTTAAAFTQASRLTAINLRRRQSAVSLTSSFTRSITVGKIVRFSAGLTSSFTRSITGRAIRGLVNTNYTMSATLSPKAFIFKIVSSSNTIVNPNSSGTASNDQFGFVLDASQNYLVVSAWNEGPVNAAGVLQGKIYKYNPSTLALTSTISWNASDTIPSGHARYQQGLGYNVIKLSGTGGRYLTAGGRRLTFQTSPREASLVYDLSNADNLLATIDYSVGSVPSFEPGQGFTSTSTKTIAPRNTSADYSNIIDIYNLTTGTFFQTCTLASNSGLKANSKYMIILEEADINATPIVPPKFKLYDPDTITTTTNELGQTVNYGTLYKTITPTGLPTGNYSSMTSLQRQQLNSFGSTWMCNNLVIATTISESSNYTTIQAYGITSGNLEYEVDLPAGLELWAMNDDYIVCGSNEIFYVIDAITGVLRYRVSNPQYFSSSNDQFGGIGVGLSVFQYNAIAFSGNKMFVGAALEDGTSITDQGVVYVFNL